MATLQEGLLKFYFPDHWLISKYDEWPFYKNQFQYSCLGCKAVDFLAFDTERKELWLIEVRDYRVHRRSKEITMWDEMALKTLHTLSGLVAAKVNSTDETKSFAEHSVACTRLRVVLHLEQPKHHSKLYPRIFNLADVQQKLRQLLKPIDAHPRVMEIDRMPNVAWTVNQIGGSQAS